MGAILSNSLTWLPMEMCRSSAHIASSSDSAVSHARARAGWIAAGLPVVCSGTLRHDGQR